MASFHLAVWGLGNIGRCVIEAAETAPDCRCLGVIRRKESLGTNQEDLRGVPEYSTLEALIEAQGKPDVVVLCGPSRQVGDQAEKLFKQNNIKAANMEKQKMEQADKAHKDCMGF